MTVSGWFWPPWYVGAGNAQSKNFFLQMGAVEEQVRKGRIIKWGKRGMKSCLRAEKVEQGEVEEER